MGYLIGSCVKCIGLDRGRSSEDNDGYNSKGSLSKIHHNRHPKAAIKSSIAWSNASVHGFFTLPETNSNLPFQMPSRHVDTRLQARISSRTIFRLSIFISKVNQMPMQSDKNSYSTLSQASWSDVYANEDWERFEFSGTCFATFTEYGLRIKNLYQFCV